MNPELQLKLQASLDGELSEGEARRLAGRTSEDAEAQQLLAELEIAKTILAGNEPEFKVPESREFYWSKIEREILRGEQAPFERSSSPSFSWRKLLAPLAGVAVVTILALGAAVLYRLSPEKSDLRYVAEIESTSEDSSSFAFRSQSENMYVVWVYDRNDDVSANEGSNHDTKIQ